MKIEQDTSKKRFNGSPKATQIKSESFFNEKVKEEKETLKTFSYDCQKNLDLLKVPDQVAYYLRNVYLYNFTIVEGSSKSKLLPEHVFAYCKAENLYPKAANKIASALYHRLKNSDLSSIETVRLVADGCAGQNKNTIMLGMLSKWLTEAPQNVKKVELVFPVVGHSYIPPDRVFAQIEKQVRKQEVIRGPEKYIEIISKFSTVTALGTDFEVFDWKTASQKVFKPVAPEMWEDYVDIDSALLTFEEPTDKNIVQNISAKEQLESDGEEEVEEAPLPTAEEALKAAELLSRFVHSNIENDNLTIA
ncbi:unnamed protein product [Pieris macdunnoughi]|uniref:DUF7869 domain-containing protein n=1 Tax=Pieris macdunnoughi TaxID=345717 RepID=A0A821UG72_9NEOP|nr:unnamed protein product [Pieris macdunnoughi]